MHVPTGNLYASMEEALKHHPASEVVTITGTLDQAETLSRAVRRANAESSKKAKRRMAQRSRRDNR